MAKKRIAIIGATGYTGSELVRILKTHPEAEIVMITSESRAGEKFSDVHPSFSGIVDDKLYKASELGQADPDLVFLALPHGVSMSFVKQYQHSKFKIVDLSGDFRLNDPETYEAWYKKEHVFREGFSSAVYGMPELFRDEIKDALLVANPGCFPTGAILAAWPLIKEGHIDPKQLIIDSKTGVTGAGVKASPVTHFSNVSDNFKAYGLKTHRHSIEMEQILNRSSGKPVNLQFTPHLLPVDRGILTTLYAKPISDSNDEKLNDIFRSKYKDEAFIRLVDLPPATKDVRASNYCNIYYTFDIRTKNIIVISVIDNLVKGAAGQAVHNMNLMLDLPENTGLFHLPVNP